MHSSNSFDRILKFERELAEFVGAPYAVMTDCCTHAIELCLRYDKISNCEFTAFTYLSIPMTMHKLGIKHIMTSEQWIGEYQFHGTRIWDSARRLERGMHRPGHIQCLSFGHSKPLNIGRGGAIILDDPYAYDALIKQRSDGRDLGIAPWQNQRTFRVGYHYRPTIEEAVIASKLLPTINNVPRHHEYPDCRLIRIID